MVLGGFETRSAASLKWETRAGGCRHRGARLGAAGGGDAEPSAVPVGPAGRGLSTPSHGSASPASCMRLWRSGGARGRAPRSPHLPAVPLQTRSSRHSQGSQPGLADQAKLSFASAESLETMSEAELPLGFNRMNRFRQSLPLSRSTSQTKLRSPGTGTAGVGDGLPRGWGRHPGRKSCPWHVTSMASGCSASRGPVPAVWGRDEARPHHP